MFNIYKNLGWFFKQEKKSYIVLFSAITFISLLSTLPPKIVGIIIDLIATDQLTKKSLMVYGGILLLVPLIIYVINLFYHPNLIYKGQILTKELRIRYITKLFASDASLFEKYNKGELISRVSNDIPSISIAATYLLSDLIYCLGLIIFVTIIMVFQISFKLTIVAFFVVPIGFIILNKWRLSMRKYYVVHRKIFAKFFDTTLESIEGMRVIRTYNQEDNDSQKNLEAMLSDISSWKYINKFEKMFGPLFAMTISISTFLTFSYGSYLVIVGDITPGELVTFYMYIVMVSGPINILAAVLNVASQADVAQSRYFEVLNRKINVVDPKKPKMINEFENFKFLNVNFNYAGESNSLKNINLEIKQGQTIAIVGESGSGKSTILKLLLREFDVTTGEIDLNGNLINNYKIDDVRNLIGYVPQNHVLFTGDIKSNLELKYTDIENYELNDAIVHAGFKQDLDNMKNGLLTKISENGVGLSGGQKQRVSIARALINDPEILILDDSLSAVDINTEKLIIDNLKSKRKGLTNIIITHRFSVAVNVDYIYVLKNGEIIESGNHESLIKLGGWYYSQYLIQSVGGNNE